MKVKDVMTEQVATCTPDTDLGTVALLMWERDCGMIPVVEGLAHKVIGTITDRDICIGLAMTGKRPSERMVREVMSPKAFTIVPGAELKDALEVMDRHKVRRLPVVGHDGKLEGVISMNDLILHASTGEETTKTHLPAPKLLQTLKAISAHRKAESAVRAGAEIAVVLK